MIPLRSSGGAGAEMQTLSVKGILEVPTTLEYRDDAIDPR